MDIKFKIKRSAAKDFTILGILLLIIGLSILIYNYVLYRNAVRVDGKIIDYDIYHGTDDQGHEVDSYQPIVEYEFKGKTYFYISILSSSTRNYELNETVSLLVDLDDPDKAIINTFRERWSNPISFIAFGIGSLLLALAIKRHGT